MPSRKRPYPWHEVTVFSKDANVSICGNTDVEDEIEILADSDFDSCLIHGDKVTFYAWKNLASKSFRKSLAPYPKVTITVAQSPEETFTVAPSPKVTTSAATGQVSNVKIESQNIVWARHTPNLPYWPCYVKRTSTNLVHVFYISRTSFSSKTMPHKKNKSEVILFSTTNSSGIEKQGLDYYRKRGLWKYFDDFQNAVSLARTYANLKRKHYFSSVKSIFDFFNSDVPVVDTEDLLSPPTTPHRVWKKRAKSTTKAKRRIFDPNLQKIRELTPDCGPYRNPKPQKIVKEKKSLPHDFSDRPTTQRVLEYILRGRCKQHIDQVLKRSFPCMRMRVFQQGLLLSTPKRREWELDNVRPYFQHDNEQDGVLKYIRTLLGEHQKKNKERIPMKQYFQLVFDVLYPETIIWAISQVDRISYDAAEMVYKETGHINLDNS